MIRWHPREAMVAIARRAVGVVAGLLLCVLLQRMYWLEALHHPWWRSAALMVAFVAGGFALTGRWLVGGYAGVLGFLALRGISRAKFAVLQQPLTAADVRDLSWVEVRELVSHYPVHASIGVALLGLMVWGAWCLARRPQRASPRVRGAALLLTGAALATAAQGLETVSIASVSPESVSVLNFMSTFFDEDPRLTSTLPPQPQVPVLQCPSSPPDVFLVLEESTFRPTDAEVRALANPTFFEGTAFASELRVHVIGGMTHLSEFAVLTGVPHDALTGENTFPQVPLEGTVRHSLPQTFKDCGYGTTTLYPTPRAFRNSARWYQSLGFEAILSGDDTGVPNWSVRDAHFFSHALKHLQSAPVDQPQLVYVLTIAQHGPHGGGDLRAEYLRRLNHSSEDWATLERGLQERALLTGRPWVLAWFGDHRPWGVGTDGPQRKITWGVIKTLGATPGPSQDGLMAAPRSAGLLDLAYFGRLVMREAGVARQPVAALQDEMMAACPAFYLDCDVGLRERYQRALLDTGAFVMP